MRVLVTGAGGRLGQVVLPRLLDEGWTVRAASRRARHEPPVEWVRLDLLTGDGIADAVAGVDAILHLASRPNSPETHRVDVLGTRRLVVAAGQAGVRHLVYVSIVGVDRVPIPYYRHKLAAEEVVAAGAAPWTVLRTTQFGGFLDELLRAASRLGVVIGDPAIVAQPVDPRDVAERLVHRITAGPLRGIEEYGGPQVLRYDEAVRAWNAARGTRRRLLPVRVPGRLGRALRAGGLVTEAAPRGMRAWSEYLTDTYGGSRAK